MAVASLRWPEYFDIIKMIQKHSDILERSWWHKHAGGLTLKLENLDKFKESIRKYADNLISQDNLEKTIYVDTYINHEERNYELIKSLQNLNRKNQKSMNGAWKILHMKLMTLKKVTMLF